MYEGNPGEIDFGSSQREVRVSEGSSYLDITKPSNLDVANNFCRPLGPSLYRVSTVLCMNFEIYAEFV